MKTQYCHAIEGTVTPAMKSASARESVSAETVMSALATGEAVLPCNPAHVRLEPVVAGRLFRTKVNANIGRSAYCSSTGEELLKLLTAVSAGADFVMDLSVGSDLGDIRRSLLAECPLPFGTVPIYEAWSRAGGSMASLTATGLIDVIREQAEQGVDFMTLHAGLLKKHVPMAIRRRLGIVSRGGAILAEWMSTYDRENPLYETWDSIMAICAEHDVTVSLGDGLRPGCLADASDEAQFAELDVLGELVLRCREAGVQAMVEGPGHVPFGQIAMNMEREREVCHGAPFYVLGPVVTDVAPGYDHITSAIGATAAAFHGASLLCYVTPSEHLALPTEDDVRQGIVAYRIAAHAADVARGLPGARDWDDRMADARRSLDWQKQFSLAIDGQTARARYERGRSQEPGDSDHCSMCGRDFCAVRTSGRLREKQ
ncbi:MAG: phosphomethylpyrimidine synthase ThiC [Lentisphaerae bacterium]|nr:phosphomethylpyrimidine synthase ThiC [Lentisphaerota bacterium]